MKQAWTSTPLLFIMPLLAYNETDDRPGQRVAFALFRWFLATAYWAILTQMSVWGHGIFHVVFNSYGTCDLGTDFRHRKLCSAEGGQWDGFDISGHCLLLIHASLFALEELEPLRRVLGRGRVSKELPQSNNSSKQTLRLVEKVLGAILVAIVGLWLVMLLSTSIYFHTWQEKLLGTAFGCAFWALSYRVLYPHLGAMP